jgi:acyl-CoA synthetase (NDP forming)
MMDLVEQYDKPVAMVVLTEAEEIGYLRRHAKVPIFTAPENAMRAFHLSHHWASRNRTSLEMVPVEGSDRSRAEAILEGAGQRDFLFLSESMDLIRSYGLPVPDYGLARSAEEAVGTWKSMGGAVALKLNRPHVSHKTDQGLVRVGLHSDQAIQDAFKAFQEKTGEEEIEVLVQPMVEQGREVMLGGRQDAVFGPVVLFGLGGVFVEAMGDVVWRVAPVQPHDARAMINGIRGRKILTGVRGEGPCDLDAIQDLLVRVSQMLVELPVIREIDVNPVKAEEAGKGAWALDARVILA